MSLINFERLDSYEDLKTYQKMTASQVGVEFPLEYLAKARVIGLKNSQLGTLHGGFTLAFNGPLRCLEQLPAHIVQESSVLQQHLEHCFEINGLWLEQESAPEGSRFRLYLKLMEEAIRLGVQGKHKYVYAYCADNQKLREFYRNFNSSEIYEGPVKALPGMEKPGFERVEMGCMKKLPLTVMRNPGFLVARAFNQKTAKLRWI